MKTTPIAKPGAAVTSNPSATTAIDGRARAIAKLSASMQSAPVQAPVVPVQGQEAPIPVNPNAISAEDLSAISSKSGQIGQSVEDTEVQQEAAVSEETAKQTTPPETPATSQMAILARKERALRAKVQQQEQAFRAREEALKAREEAIKTKDQQYQSEYISKQRIKQDLAGVMAEEGLSYDELTQQLINQQPENPRVKAQLAKLEAQNKLLEDKLSAWEKNTQDQQTNAYKAAVQQIETDVKNLVKSDPNFEAIRMTNSAKDVVELIEETYKKDGVLLSVEEAAQEVEDYLIEEATKFTRLEKIKKRLQPTASTQAKVESQTPVKPKQPQPMKTLTNATASTRQLSAKERAILAFKGELKS